MSDKYAVLRRDLPELVAEAKRQGGINPRAQLIIDLLAERDELAANTAPQPAEQQPSSAYACTVPDDCETLHWRGQILSMNELASVAQPAAGEEIMVNTPGDVYTLPMQPSGLTSGPRFVVHVPAQQPCPEGIREGSPYDDPTFAALCREHEVYGTAAAAQCAVFWEAGKRAGQQPAPDVAGLAASLYQACGAYDMPERILDVLSAAANGEPFEHMIDGLLPCVPPSDQDVAALVDALTELCDEIDKHDIHAAISSTSILWFKRKAREALAAYRKQKENK